VAIGWTTYTGCPTGYALSGYTFNLTNATFASGSSNPFAKDATSANIVLGSPGEATVNYTATCGTGSGAFPSAVSGTLSITVN